MLVATVVIPILFLYFYILTKKDYKEHHQRWLTVGDVREDTVIKGTLIRSMSNKQRFYHHKKVFELHLFIKKDHRQIKIVYKQPITKEFKEPTIKLNQSIKCFGHWNNDHFLANRVIQN